MTARLLGIDYGAKRVGVALSDERGTIAFPKCTFPNDAKLISTVASLIREESVGAVVVGESKDKDGNENAIMKKVHEFVAELKSVVEVEVRYEPEFYTSVEARRLPAEAGDDVSGAVDAHAAALILNSFITRRNNAAGVESPQSESWDDDLK